MLTVFVRLSATPRPSIQGHDQLLPAMQMLDLSVQPPQEAQPGVALWPPVAARLRSSSNIYGELTQYWTMATLIDHNGETLSDQLGGRITDSAHPMQSTGHRSSHRSSSRDQAYFFFPDLTIHYPGRYRIRITLMRMDYSDETSEGVAIVEEYVDSRTITVDEGTTSFEPSRREREFLRMLRHDGQDVPSVL